MSSLVQIARSWYDYIKGTPYTKQLMAKRLAVCDDCEDKVLINETGKVIMKVISNDPNGTYQCGVCHCPLVAKTAGTANECPKRKWLKAGEESYF